MSNHKDYGGALARMTVEQRLEAAAIEMRNLRDITHPTPWLNSIFEDIEERNYEQAISKATGNWEPQDGEAWSGGIAENH